MRIVWYKIEKSGRDVTVAFIDTGGIDLGIDVIPANTDLSEIDRPDEDVIDTTETDVDVDITDIVEPDEPNIINSEEPNVLNIPPVTTDDDVFDLNKLYFGVGTFSKLKSNEAMWNQLFLAPNKFFSQMSVEDTRQFCLFYIDARRIIDRELRNGRVTEVTTRIGNLFYDLAVDIDLSKKLDHYVRVTSGIPIPFEQLSKAGTNVGRDTEELTFKLDEYYVLLSISIVCKIMCPIWGDIIERTDGDIKNIMKKTYCMNTIEPFLTLELFRNVRDKLYYYVNNTIESTMKSHYVNSSFNASMGGVSRDRLTHIIFSILIIKNYVTVDLYKPVDEDGRNGNIVVWTYICSKSSFTSLQQTLNRCPIMPRIDIFDNDDYGGDDERKISVLEHGSHITEVTADIPLLVRFGVRMAIKKLLRKYQISDLEYRETISYYRENLVKVTSFNKILICIFFGEYIGGAQGIKYLDSALFSELVAITQIFIATNEVAPDVVHLLTADTIEEERPVPALSNTNMRISMTSRQTGEWKRCESAFPYSIDRISIDDVLLRVQNQIIKRPHFANTAPLVCGLLDQDPLQKGTLIKYEYDVMQQYCRVILGITNPTGYHITERKAVKI